MADKKIEPQQPEKDEKAAGAARPRRRAPAASCTEGRQEASAHHTSPEPHASARQEPGPSARALCAFPSSRERRPPARLGRDGRPPSPPHRARSPRWRPRPCCQGCPEGGRAARRPGLGPDGSAAGTYLCHQGDPSPEVYFLVDGRIEISSFSPTGARVLHAIGGHARSSSASSASSANLPRERRPADARGHRRLDGPRRGLHRVHHEPAGGRPPDCSAALARQIQEHQAFADDLLFLDLKGRVAKRLLQMGTLLARGPAATPARRFPRSRTPTSRACAAAAGRT